MFNLQIPLHRGQQPKVIYIMFNLRYLVITFGYSTTHLFTILFPCQFFIYNYTKVLVSKSSFNTITVNIYYQGFCAYMFVCDQHIFSFGNI